MPASVVVTLPVLLCSGHRELQAVSAAVQALLSPPASVAAALKGIQKTSGKALPFKVGSSWVAFRAVVACRRLLGLIDSLRCAF